MKKNKDIYYVEVRYGEKPYSITDKDTVKKIRTAELLMWLFASLTFLMLITTIIVASLVNHYIISIIVFVIGMIVLGVFICLGFHFGDKRDMLTHNSSEYQEQEEAYFIEEAERKKRDD